MIEEWKDIIGYEKLYQVSNLGRIKSLSRIRKAGNGEYITKEFIMTTILKRNGYKDIVFVKEKIKKHFYIHRLVAQAFIPNLLNKGTVNHINGIKTDNRVENLELMTSKENMQHAYNIGLNNSNHMKRKVVMLSLNKEPLLTFDSINEAGKESGANISSISACCRERRKTAGGYKWQYY